MIKRVFSWIFAGLVAGAFALSNPAHSETSVWQTRCNASECNLFSELRQSDGTLISNIQFRKMDRDTYVGIATLPFGFFVPDGVKLAVDRKKFVAAKIISCSSKGCEAAFLADQANLELFRRGKKLSVLLTRVTDRRQLALHYSLMGFTKGWADFVMKSSIQVASRRGSYD